MDRKIVGKRPTFRPARKGPNFYWIMILLALIMAGIWVLLNIERGQIKSPLEPTPTPTRVAESYLMEAQAYIDAGKLDDPSNTTLSDDVPSINDAIEAYQEALERNPDNAQAWAELARIQTYSSSMLRNDADRMKRLEEALESADKSVELEPDESTTTPFGHLSLTGMRLIHCFQTNRVRNI